MPERTDKELLELAAKAAGYPGKWDDDFDSVMVPATRPGCEFMWNPLKDDGQALRLAVELELELRLRHSENAVRAYGAPSGAIDEGVHGEPLAATRRAIVRAAAEIGANMQS